MYKKSAFIIVNMSLMVFLSFPIFAGDDVYFCNAGVLNIDLYYDPTYYGHIHRKIHRVFAL